MVLPWGCDVARRVTHGHPSIGSVADGSGGSGGRWWGQGFPPKTELPGLGFGWRDVGGSLFGKRGPVWGGVTRG
jgi:hypothetical protein